MSEDGATGNCQTSIGVLYKMFAPLDYSQSQISNPLKSRNRVGANHSAALTTYFYWKEKKKKKKSENEPLWNFSSQDFKTILTPGHAERGLMCFEEIWLQQISHA